jgi:hypothetical protein
MRSLLRLSHARSSLARGGAGSLVALAAIAAGAAETAPETRRVLTARASALDDRARPHAEIDFVFEKDGKPQDVQHASVDTAVPSRGRLVVWLMGYNDSLFQRLNAYGLHAVQPHYANKWFGIVKPTDRMARGQVRLEAATGRDVSPQVDIPFADGMAERTHRLVAWLATEHPEGKWGQFLAADGSGIDWTKVCVAGASHGATTAARFAKEVRVDRVVMLCGPRDQDQDWQSLPSQTPAERYFGFSHVLDGGWTGDHYCRSWELLGLNRFGPIVDVDDARSPYGNTRRLVSAADVGGDAGRAHGAVTPGRGSPKAADGSLLYEPVWRYLFTHPVDAIGAEVPRDPECEQDHPLGR